MGRSRLLRRSDRAFFREDGLISDDEISEGLDPVTAAYWLAKQYHQHPSAFLAEAPEDILRHVELTAKMMKITSRLAREST